MRALAHRSPAIQAQLRDACSKSVILWFNAFAWTLRQRKATPDGFDVPVTGAEAIQPLITWPVQDEYLDKLVYCVSNGVDLNVLKSREMGASWVTALMFDWAFLFWTNTHLGIVSRKEELVDDRDNPDSLFEKIRFAHRHMPTWMVGKIRSRHMHLANVTTKCTIDGESTNQDVGRGGRKVAYLIDEAAAVPNAEEVEAALASNTACMLWVSTPQGPATRFRKRIQEEVGEYFEMMWWRHPEKAVGAEQYVDVTGTVKWTSPWRRQKDKEMSARKLAQEVDGEHGKSGETFFPFDMLQTYRKEIVKHPIHIGALEYLVDTEDGRCKAVRERQHHQVFWSPEGGRKSWRLWIDLIDGRPPQYNSYVFGVDVANGTGSSNSVITVIAVETGSVVAKFWDAWTSPDSLATLAALSGIWFGGRFNPPLIVWENNGPGGTFTRKLQELRYPSYYLQRVSGTTTGRQTQKLGWHSSREAKEEVIGAIRDAMTIRQLINPCAESIGEAEDYIYDSGGLLVPARLREENMGGDALHGDQVIADALAWHGRMELPRHHATHKKYPPGSYGWRKDQRIKKKNRAAKAWRV